MINAILHSFRYSLAFLREQVADVSLHDLTTQPHGVSNHPAWMIGHLTWTCQLMGGAIGLQPWLPSDDETRFGSGSVPLNDPARYDEKDLLLAKLADAESRIVRAVQELSEEQLEAPFPDPSYRDVFPTIRHALLQVLVGHTAFHVGQLSVWRRAMQLPAMKRSYE